LRRLSKPFEGREQEQNIVLAALPRELCDILLWSGLRPVDEWRYQMPELKWINNYGPLIHTTSDIGFSFSRVSIKG